jgi:two-component SAPR family response regulator
MRKTVVASSTKARPKRVMVVEDDSLSGLAMAEHLVELGYIVIGPATTVSEARRLANVASMDAAFLDLNLHGICAGQVADILIRRQIPFLFITGYDRSPRGYENIAVLTKPYQSTDLRRAIEALVMERANFPSHDHGTA